MTMRGSDIQQALDLGHKWNFKSVLMDGYKAMADNYKREGSSGDRWTIPISPSSIRTASWKNAPALKFRPDEGHA